MIIIVDNSLTGGCVLVSDPYRMKHPWNGQVEPPRRSSCLGTAQTTISVRERNGCASGQQNGKYEHKKCFRMPVTMPAAHAKPHPLFPSEPVVGVCSVLNFHLHRDWTLAGLHRKTLWVLLMNGSKCLGVVDRRNAPSISRYSR
jgi:UDPglucose--hexose-1-phosphate uridylyltransferase